jgi:TonB family protein
VLPNAVVTLTNADTQAKYEVRTNRDGRYEIPGLPAGRYVLESRVPGFQAITLELSLGGENVDRDLRLDLGTVQETITVGAGPGFATRAASSPPPAQTEPSRAQSMPPCPGGVAATAGPAIGGNIRTPKKLRDRRPIYPAEYANTGVSGHVLLQATISTDGAVRDIAVQSASNDEFAAAARDAVAQWEFAATLLNCVPVDTRMNVTVNFTYRP